MTLLRLLLVIALFPAFAAAAEDTKKEGDTKSPAKQPADPAARIKAPKGFQVDLLYSVPQEQQGSWVNMTVDPRGG